MATLPRPAARRPSTLSSSDARSIGKVSLQLRGRALDIAVSAAIFLVSFAVYNATLTPSLSYLSPDGNELATVPYILGLAHSTGYPLYTWIGKLFTYLPIGDVAHRMNLMSAVMGAAAIAVMYWLLVLLSEHIGNAALSSQLRAKLARIIAASTALVFAFSPTFWSQTSIAEVYAPNLLLVALQTLLIVHWGRVEEADPAQPGQPPTGRSLAWFGAFCLVFALSTGTHFSNLGFGLGYAVFVLAINPRFAVHPRALLVGIGAFALGMLQHLWLPLKADSLVDAPMRANAPNTVQGFYNYTLGAFPNFKFAFPWPEVPGRIVIYLDLLRQQFTLAGILMGVAGMGVLVFRLPKRWWLLALMYLVHVTFFTQYRAFDLDVFFIPAHFLFALFTGMGAFWLIGLIVARLNPDSRGVRVSLVVVAALFALLPILQAQAHWAKSDRSEDIAINDFYLNVFEMLPQGSVLIGQGGVFGYDMFYWRLVYDVRPDVIMPMLPEAKATPEELAGRPIYSTVSLDNQQQRRSPWGIPPGLVDPDVWSIPVLYGSSAPSSGRQSLVLYRISESPPELLVSGANPSTQSGTQFGNLILLGYDLDTTHARPGGRLALTFYWQAERYEPVPIITALGTTQMEIHALGLGNLPRMIQTLRLTSGTVLVESYSVVLPSTLEVGRWPLTVVVGDISAVITEVVIEE